MRCHLHLHHWRGVCRFTGLTGRGHVGAQRIVLIRGCRGIVASRAVEAARHFVRITDAIGIGIIVNDHALLTSLAQAVGESAGTVVVCSEVAEVAGRGVVATEHFVPVTHAVAVLSLARMVPEPSWAPEQDSQPEANRQSSGLESVVDVLS